MTAISGINVSRETDAALGAFLDAVARWTVKINLVSRGSIADLRARHLVDSAQLLSHLGPTDTSWADLGSGGGFPGIVIAILARDNPTAVNSLFLAILTRLPTPEELSITTQRLARQHGESRSRQLCDLAWVLLNCSEFGWSH